MKYTYRPANFKDLKEALHYIMYSGPVFFKKEEITFQLLEEPFGFTSRTVLELGQLKSILSQLTIREEISEIQLWEDQLKNGSILCHHKYNFPVYITDIIAISGQGISAGGLRYKLEDLTPISKDGKIFASADFIDGLKNLRGTAENL